MCQRIRFTRVELGFLLLSLSACQNEAPEPAASGTGSVAAAATTAAPVDACVLLPASEVEQIFGRAVTDSLALSIPATAETAPVSQCNYGTLENPAIASLLIRGGAPGETGIQTASRSVRETLAESGIALADVTGLGEVSFWGGNQLHVFAGNGWYLVVSPEPGVGLPQARAMAERAIARF
jgi:hypothetical protein